MKKILFWLRWAWRDLRVRWPQVAAIAFIIALATGIFAGLGGQETWRIASMDLSYDTLVLHDLKVNLTTGSFLPEETVLTVLDGIDDVAVVEPRLVMDTMLDASTDEETILVSGRLIGVSVSQGGPWIERIHLDEGRPLHAGTTQEVILESKFARYYDLEPGIDVRLMGGFELNVVGTGVTPEYFMVTPPEKIGFDMLGESSMAIMYMPLPAVQTIFQQQGYLNEILVQVDDDADVDLVKSQITERLGAEFPEIGFFLSAGEDDPGLVMMYEDAVEDQQMLNLIAMFFLIGASLASFNLAGRLVESQRRQIGIGMALGIPRWKLALRPMLVGAQIAVLGLAFGIPLGLGFTRYFGILMDEMAPLPYYAGTLLHPPSFLMAAGLGIVLPVVSTLIPVLRAVRSEPLDAIHGHLAAKDSGLNRWLKGVRLPGDTFSQMPIKNLLRSPRRTLLTIAGIMMAIALLFMFTALLDTFLGTLDQVENAIQYRSPNRLLIALDRFYPQDLPQMDDLRRLETPEGDRLMAETESWLRLGGRLHAEDEQIEVLLDVFPADSKIWVPNLLKGELVRSNQQSGDQEKPGIILSRRAVSDFDLEIGDSLILEHPLREGLVSFRSEQTEVLLVGIHDNPARGVSYMAMEEAGFMGLTGLTNTIVALPAEGVSQALIKEQFFFQPGILKVEATAEFLDFMDDVLVIFTQALRVMQVVGMLIAVLIAYNSTVINIDDRQREIATMLAFGVRLRRIILVEIGENVILGAIGTVLGAVLGWWVLERMMLTRMETMLEEIQFVVTVRPFSVIAAVTLGVGFVALTPLISARKLRRIDVPSTLRVLE